MYGEARRQAPPIECPTSVGRSSAGSSSSASQRANVRGQVGHGLGLTEPGNVGNHDAVVLGEPLDHRRPERAPGLDGAVQQDERRAVACLEQRGGAGEPRAALRDRQARQHRSRAEATVTPTQLWSGQNCGGGGGSLRPPRPPAAGAPR